jgi:hypothetical protein
VPDLRVASSWPSDFVAGPRRRAHGADAARALRPPAVSAAGDRICWPLTDAETGEQIWSKAFDRRLVEPSPCGGDRRRSGATGARSSAPTPSAPARRRHRRPGTAARAYYFWNHASPDGLEEAPGRCVAVALDRAMPRRAFPPLPDRARDPRPPPTSRRNGRKGRRPRRRCSWHPESSVPGNAGLVWYHCSHEQPVGRCAAVEIRPSTLWPGILAISRRGRGQAGRGFGAS